MMNSKTIWKKYRKLLLSFLIISEVSKSVTLLFLQLDNLA